MILAKIYFIGLVSFCFISESYQATPYLTLYSDYGGTGLFYNTTFAIRDLHDFTFDNRINSVCGVGIWFLYEDADWSCGTNFVFQFIHGEYACEDLPESEIDKVTALRYPGTLFNPTEDSLTLYKFDRFTGFELLLMRDLSEFEFFDNRENSLVVTGSSPWTIYKHEGYQGDSYCVFSNTFIDGITYGFYYVDDLPFKNEASSARMGCHTFELVGSNEIIL